MLLLTSLLLDDLQDVLPSGVQIDPFIFLEIFTHQLYTIEALSALKLTLTLSKPVDEVLEDLFSLPFFHGTEARLSLQSPGYYEVATQIIEFIALLLK